MVAVRSSATTPVPPVATRILVIAGFALTMWVLGIVFTSAAHADDLTDDPESCRKHVAAEATSAAEDAGTGSTDVPADDDLLPETAEDPGTHTTPAAGIDPENTASQEHAEQWDGGPDETQNEPATGADVDTVDNSDTTTGQTQGHSPQRDHPARVLRDTEDRLPTEVETDETPPDPVNDRIRKMITDDVDRTVSTLAETTVASVSAVTEAVEDRTDIIPDTVHDTTADTAFLLSAMPGAPDGTGASDLPGTGPSLTDLPSSSESAASDPTVSRKAPSAPPSREHDRTPDSSLDTGTSSHFRKAPEWSETEATPASAVSASDPETPDRTGGPDHTLPDHPGEGGPPPTAPSAVHSTGSTGAVQQDNKRTPGPEPGVPAPVSPTTRLHVIDTYHQADVVLASCVAALPTASPD